MNTLSFIFLVTSIISIALVVWSYTKSGKKWIDKL